MSPYILRTLYQYRYMRSFFPSSVPPSVRLFSLVLSGVNFHDLRFHLTFLRPTFDFLFSRDIRKQLSVQPVFDSSILRAILPFGSLGLTLFLETYIILPVVART